MMHLDFETQSACDLRETGAWIYAKHPTTTILCAAFNAGDGCETQLIEGDRLGGTDALYQAALDPDVIFSAHSAQFEQAIWAHIMVPKLGYPPIPIHRWRCTAAKAAAMSLPRSLDGVGEELDLPIRKDKEGYKIMMKLSRPRNRTKAHPELRFWTYDDAPDDFEDLYRYCIRDVEVEMTLDSVLPDLNTREQEVWFLDQKINQAGITIDVDFLDAIQPMIADDKADTLQRLSDITSGRVTPDPFSEWLEANGCPIPNLQAATVRSAIRSEDTRPYVKEALTLWASKSKVSTSKYEAMRPMLDTDNKVRGLFLYSAALTKRWGGQKIQPHNLPRGTVNSDVAVDIIKHGNLPLVKGLYSDTMAMFSSCVRGAFVPDNDCVFYVGDFSAIEARVLAWLAGQESTLAVFRSGADVYCKEAVGIFGREVTKYDKYERSVGKVSVLALGYNGGISAFGQMSSSYSLDLRPAYKLLYDGATCEEQTAAGIAYQRYATSAIAVDPDDVLDEQSGIAADIIKQRWRAANPNIVNWWYALERAAIEAVTTGRRVKAGKVTFAMHGTSLLCKLPSGNCIVYPSAKVEKGETAWGAVKNTLKYRGEVLGRWTWISTYGGKLAENIVQAESRTLLADAMLRLDTTGFDIRMHVHDEVVANVPKKDTGVLTLALFAKVLAQVPPWAEGLPMGVDCWQGERYRK